MRWNTPVYAPPRCLANMASWPSRVVFINYYVYIVNIIGTTYLTAKGKHMPRQPDPGLEERILNAARKLWRKGSGKALTMRAVARAARTNTPAVYRRFPHRDDILRALVHETRQDWFRLVETSSSVEDACERYLDYGLSHP